MQTASLIIAVVKIVIVAFYIGEVVSINTANVSSGTYLLVFLSMCALAVCDISVFIAACTKKWGFMVPAVIAATLDFLLLIADFFSVLFPVDYISDRRIVFLVVDFVAFALNFWFIHVYVCYMLHLKERSKPTLPMTIAPEETKA